MIKKLFLLSFLLPTAVCCMDLNVPQECILPNGMHLIYDVNPVLITKETRINGKLIKTNRIYEGKSQSFNVTHRTQWGKPVVDRVRETENEVEKVITQKFKVYYRGSSSSTDKNVEGEVLYINTRPYEDAEIAKEKFEEFKKLFEQCLAIEQERYQHFKDSHK